jgi:hypothetical protein
MVPAERGWKRLRGARLKAVYAEREKAQVVERDPVHGMLYNLEIEYQRRRLKRSNGHDTSPNGHGPNGQGR